MAAEVSAVAKVIHSAGMLILQIGNGWYKASAATKSFPLKVAVLEQQSNNWRSVINSSGISEDPSIRKVLEEANKLLDQEKAKFEQMQSSCSCVRMGKKLFPDSVTACIEDITSACEMASKQLEKASTLSLVARLPFVEDSKFVEFKTTITKVRTALESETTGSVVTILGGPGEGKTTMARHLALLYQNTSTLDRPETRRFEDGVFFLSCGPNADSKDLLLNLWQDLGYGLLPSPVEVNQDQASTSNNRPEQSIEWESIHYRELTKRLSSQKVLIVLDDVCESLLQKLIVRGKSIKYLTTTRQSKLYGDASCVQISIPSPTSEEACQILKNHVWEFPKESKPSLQAEMDAIVDKSAHNPIVLANIATNIRHGKADDLEEWKFTRRYFEDLVQDDVRVFPVLFGRTYSKRTLGASTKMAWNSFSNEEQMLLLLASICESQPIPEVVFKIFFERIHVLGTYLHSGVLDDEGVSMLVTMPKAISSMTDALSNFAFSNSIPQKCLPKTVCAVVNLLNPLDRKDPSLIPNALTMLSCITFQSIPTQIEIGIVPGAIRKLVALLAKDESPNSQEGAALALANIAATMVENEVKIGLVPGAIEKLVELLAKNESPNSQANATLALANVSNSTIEIKVKIGLILGAIEKLVALLAKDESPNSQEWATRALTNIAANVVQNKTKIGLVPGAIEKLVALLAKDESPNSQEWATRALTNIVAIVVENKIKIGLVPGAIKKLLAFLAKNEWPSSQKWAALALAHIANCVVESGVKRRLVPSAIEKLVTLLAEDEIPDSEEWAIMVLVVLEQAGWRTMARVRMYG